MEREWIRSLRGARSFDTHEFDLFSWYLTESDALVSRIESEEAEAFQLQMDSGHPDPNDSGFIAVAYYSRRLRYSHVIYLASLLETIMRRECQRLILALGAQLAPFGPSDIKGDSWRAKKKVLERYGHFEIPKTLWDPVESLLTVRNTLVHDNGVVDDEQKMRSMARISGLLIVSNEILIEPEFVTAALSTVKTLASHLDQHVGDVIDRRLRPRSLL